jgi:type II secretion system protein C
LAAVVADVAFFLLRIAEMLAVLAPVLAVIVAVLACPRAVAVTVVGVIASEQGGVALIRTKEGANPIVARAGEEIQRDVIVRRITREFVYLQIKGKLERAKVGEELVASLAPEAGSYSGIERRGNQVRITTQLRDHIVRHELGKVLMQAAAVPYYINGQLRGFRLWDIDANSVFDLAGLKDGDIVMAINGSDIVDVGGAIRMLQRLKDESDASVTIVREGAEQVITIAVQ